MSMSYLKSPESLVFKSLIRVYAIENNKKIKAQTNRYKIKWDV